MNKLTADELAAFQSIFNRENNVALMRCTMWGEDCAVITRVFHNEGEGKVEASPIALLLTDRVFDLIIPPENPFSAMEQEGQIEN
jgi:hypothetical protein